jgi:SNF2 family DNA or RNA helicase
VQAFFISIKAGGTGLNLTAADYVFILDPWWNPSTEQQAIARAHRIGQEKSVMALKFITRESIEEKILHLQEKKSLLAEDILSGTNTHQLNRNELNFLLS